MSDALYERVKDQHPRATATTLSLKGKTTSVHAYRLNESNEAIATTGQQTGAPGTP
jgi:class 3 adenylate cyclase